MDDRGGHDGGSFVAVRRISQGLDRNNTCHTASDDAVAGSRTWLGRSLSCVCVQRKEGDSRPSFDLTPAEEDCLQRLQNRLDIASDGSIPEHQEALRALWKGAFPEEELSDLISEQWKEMGWQWKDPSTDVRVVGSYNWKTYCISPEISRFDPFISKPFNYERCTVSPLCSVSTLESEQILSFVPPDGLFKLMSYRVKKLRNCPIYVKPQLSSDSGTCCLNDPIP